MSYESMSEAVMARLEKIGDDNVLQHGEREDALARERQAARRVTLHVAGRVAMGEPVYERDRDGKSTCTSVTERATEERVEQRDESGKVVGYYFATQPESA